MANMVNELNDGLSEVCKLAGILEHGCLNIVISEKLSEMVKTGKISSFEIKNNNTIYIHCEGHIAEHCDSYGTESN